MNDHYLELVAGLLAAESHADQVSTSVAQSIEQLPMASPAQAVAGLTRVLGTLLQSGGPPVERQKGLELALKPMRALVAGLEAQILVESHPLPPAKADMAAAVLALCRRYGDACCLAVYEATAPTGRVSLFARGRLARLLALAHASLAQALRLSYQLYEVPPAGLWQRLHSVYAFAMERGLDKRDVAIGDRRRSLRERYAAALLLAMSNPYACQRSELPRVVAACHALAPLATLLQQAGGNAAVGSDNGPGYLPQERGRSNHGGLSLDLGAVIAQVRDLLAWHPPEVEQIALRQRRGGEVEVPRYLLERLLKSWLGSVERGFERIEAQHSLETVLGLHTLHQALAGGQGFDSFQRQLSGREIELGAQDAASWTSVRGSDSLSVIEVRILDQSLGGYRLLWPRQQRLRVRIGELVGLSPAIVGGVDRGPDSPWLIGIVRWLRSETNGDLHVGVELLARNARPAAIRGIDDKGARSPVQRALLIELENGAQKLLLPSVGGRQFRGYEIGSPADRMRNLAAMRGVVREAITVEPLGTAYYRVSLSDSANPAA